MFLNFQLKIIICQYASKTIQYSMKKKHFVFMNTVESKSILLFTIYSFYTVLKIKYFVKMY